MRRDVVALALACIAVFILFTWSLATGTASLSLIDLVRGTADADQIRTFALSRLPRTLAVVLAGASMAMAGLIMQMLVRNRYVEPSTTGVTESASLGILVVTIVAPQASVVAKMSVAIVAALAGTLLLLALIRALPHRDLIVVPLIGILLTGIIGAGVSALAWKFQLQGTVAAWSTGDFSGIIKGRYELLWIVAITGIIAYLLADAFTVLALGDGLAANLGLRLGQVRAAGLAIVAVVAGVTTVVAGALPFLGLVVPNVVSLLVGDYLRRCLPFVAVGGAGFVLIADILARTIVAPAEIPVGTVMGVLGGAVFVIFLLTRTGVRQ
ncbi:iron chelate uptake ABC transporter family permease subunit [Winkia sp. C62]|uniref:Iron chelate uptake ABC transporter family permease subunit n=2 Tax=Nanchangia anserum TaxID=2692125 RepID=A0A8I0KQI4_9ACTO|nr:iron chelate uptake ABC transporter family permease subunit [Nanchangia anserum]MBD3690020.1 iron chelate uptake ABC transporter family permease subunit [Nanchangia anserum]